MVVGPHSHSPIELVRLHRAERAGRPFLVYRDGRGELTVRDLGRAKALSIGRLAGNDVVLDWDPEVSRVHARLERQGDLWTVVDDGLSRNGTFLEGERVAGRRRLADGQTVKVGRTQLLFRSPSAGTVETAAADDAATLASLTPADRRVLAALCRPIVDGGPGAVPASNRQIADELCLSVEGVKARLRSLFAKLEVGELPQNQKRAELARRALAAGLVVSPPEGTARATSASP